MSKDSDKIYKPRGNPAFHPLLWAIGLGWWFSVFWFGFFKTILWTIIGGAILGIIIYLKENTRV